MHQLNKYANNIIPHKTIAQNTATSFAPSNIALCKYWGKRDEALNLPVTSSLSMSIAQGTITTIKVATEDSLLLNGKSVDRNESFYQRLFSYLDLFRDQETFFEIHTENTVPTAAGLASSASGFAALIQSLNELYDWQLDKTQLSLLARIGSGSASRSLWTGLVEWHAGDRDDGMDSFAEPLNIDWPELQIESHIISSYQKPMSSREAMNITTQTSPLYQQWPEIVKQDLIEIKAALQSKDFKRLGEAVEHNAIKMHETMHRANPSINYDLPESIQLKQKIKQLRQQGQLIYFTQDAGPNIKTLSLKK